MASNEPSRSAELGDREKQMLLLVDENLGEAIDDPFIDRLSEQAVNRLFTVISAATRRACTDALVDPSAATPCGRLARGALAAEESAGHFPALDTAGQRQLLKHFFALTERGPQEANRDEPEPKQMVDGRTILAIKMHLQDELRCERNHWRDSLIDSYLSHKDRWHEDFRAEVCGKIENGEIADTKHFRQEYGLLGMSRLQRLIADGFVVVSAAGELALGERRSFCSKNEDFLPPNDAAEGDFLNRLLEK